MSVSGQHSYRNSKSCVPGSRSCFWPRVLPLRLHLADGVGGRCFHVAGDEPKIRLEQNLCLCESQRPV